MGVIGGADGPTAIFVALGDGFAWAALGILAVFYLIYFAKMLAQRRRGIRTAQLGGRKEKSALAVERWLSLATALLVPVQLLSIDCGWSAAPFAVRAAGAALGTVGDAAFFAAAVTMRDSWRAGIPEKDRTALVTRGVYRFSRNPAFLGFDLAYLGILLMFFNPLLLLFTAWAAIMLHLQILQEERFLAGAFGAPYLDYKKRTARYLGRKRR